MSTEINKAIEYVKKNKSQSHLCICNNFLFDATVIDGVYGFPHSGKERKKSFWRSIAALCNIGPNDLIFLYRTNGGNAGCKEIHGPFKVYSDGLEPCLYYEWDSDDLEMKIGGVTDCQARYLFTSFGKNIYSISENFELIKKFETKDVWGYRHPAVMNIGAARKKSMTSFTNKQTLIILDLMREFGKKRIQLDEEIPNSDRVLNYESILPTKYRFKVNDEFIKKNNSTDEAYLYSYIIRAIKFPKSEFRTTTLNDFRTINGEMLKYFANLGFDSLQHNILLEIVITNHLQDELDIVLTDIDDRVILIFELKSGMVTQDAIVQTEKYLDLMDVIFPEKIIVSNIVGKDFEKKIKLSQKFHDRIKLVKYQIEQQPEFRIRFKPLS